MTEVRQHQVVFPFPALQPPEPGRVDVWLMDLESLPMMVGADQSQVSEPSSLIHARRDLRIRQQLYLRLLFGRYLGLPGKDVRMMKTAEGKPYLADHSLKISLSHTRQWLAVGVSASGPIGIDIEMNRVIARASAMAKRCYSEKEAAFIDSLDEPERSRLFLDRWIRTEALVKAQGVTLAKSLSGIHFDLPELSLHATPADWPSADRWTLAPLQFSEGLIGAVASQEAISAIDCHHVSMGAS